MIRQAAVVVGLITAAVAGYATGRARAERPPAVPAPPSPPERGVATTPPDPPGCPSTRTTRAQLALCMAYHPPPDEKDRELSMCRHDLARLRASTNLADCHLFADMVPYYEQVLGAADVPLEAKPSFDECLDIITWSERARLLRASCLAGTPPPGFVETYGRVPILERPRVRACQKTAVIDAWLAREEARGGIVGLLPGMHLRVTGDAGILWAGPDGLHPPDIHEDP